MGFCSLTNQMNSCKTVALSMTNCAPLYIREKSQYFRSLPGKPESELNVFLQKMGESDLINFHITYKSGMTFESIKHSSDSGTVSACHKFLQLSSHKTTVAKTAPHSQLFSHA